MTINGFKIRQRVLCPKYKSNKIKGVVLTRVFILGFFVLNCIRVSPIPKYWSSNSPRVCFSSSLVVLSSSWDRFVDNLVFSASPALQTQREPVSDVLVLQPKLDCKTLRTFTYSSTREQSNKRSGTRLKTESETGERRLRLLRYALPISLLILRKKPTVSQSNRNRPYVTLLGSRGRTDGHAGEKTMKWTRKRIACFM